MLVWDWRSAPRQESASVPIAALSLRGRWRGGKSRSSRIRGSSLDQHRKARAAPIRVLIAKVGLDGHDRGVKIVARALRDAGMEVIYTGLHRTPDEIVNVAVQEDVDVIGVSLLSGAHMTAFPRIIELMKAQDIFDDVILLGGGVMPDEDIAQLKRLGVVDVLGQDTPPDAIGDAVRRVVLERGRRM